MSTDERTTHFAGFAKAVRQEEQNKVCGIGLNDWTPTKAEKVGRDAVARRVYDLACHIVCHLSESDLAMVEAGLLSTQQCVDQIPDMPELPKVEE